MSTTIRFGSILLFTAFLSACEQTSIATHDGQRIKLSDYKNKWVVVNYWAIWCEPCREEIPELNHLANTRSDVAVFAINYDGVAGNALSQQIDEVGLRIPSMLTDPSEYWNYPRPTVLPTTVIFSPKGKLHATLTGPQTLPSLEQALQ